MASGFKTHPIIVNALKEIGIKEWQVTQTYGNAAASSGFHLAEGNYNGQLYSSCTDLSISVLNKKNIDLLIEAGFCPYARIGAKWNNNEHIHTIFVGLKDSNGKITIKPGPKQQIISWYKGYDGLVGNNKYSGSYAPTEEQKQQIKQQFNSWSTHISTDVFYINKISNRNNEINCYAFLENEIGKVRCDIQAFYNWFNIKTTITQNKIIAWKNDKQIDLTIVKPKKEGWFWRGNLAELAKTIGLYAELKFNSQTLRDSVYLS